MLTKYLLPVVTELERKSNPNASGSEAYGWLPPPLINEGKKVQTAWLHDFLWIPTRSARPYSCGCRKFNMSSSEATALANYFAAVDNAEFPYAYVEQPGPRRGWRRMEAEYREAVQAARSRWPELEQQRHQHAPPGMQRLDDAMKIVVNGNFCVKCHLVADYSPAGQHPGQGAAAGRCLSPAAARIRSRLDRQSEDDSALHVDAGEHSLSRPAGRSWASFITERTSSRSGSDRFADELRPICPPKHANC